MKKKSKVSQNTSLKNPAIIMAAIAIVMIILIIIFNIRSKLNSNKLADQTQTNQIETSEITIDKNSAYAKTIDKYFQALKEKDGAKLISVFPENENYTKENAEKQISQMYTTYETQCGSNVKISYEFVKAAEIHGSTLEELKKQIASVYKISSGISNIYTFEINIIKTGDISSSKDVIYINLAKINGNWYLV